MSWIFILNEIFYSTQGTVTDPGLLSKKFFSKLDFLLDPTHLIFHTLRKKINTEKTLFIIV